jgi:hypothetical protein
MACLQAANLSERSTLRLKSGHTVSHKRPPTLLLAFIPSYELALAEASLLQRIPNWAVMIVDEGHRLKNKSSRLFGELAAVRAHFRLLLTGAVPEPGLGGTVQFRGGGYITDIELPLACCG